MEILQKLHPKSDFEKLMVADAVIKQQDRLIKELTIENKKLSNLYSTAVDNIIGLKKEVTTLVETLDPEKKKRVIMVKKAELFDFFDKWCSEAATKDPKKMNEKAMDKVKQYRIAIAKL